MFKEKIESMEDGKDKELLKILEDKANPFMRKCDGYAAKVDEDKEITYKDYNDQELTLKVPAGSYVVLDKDYHCPKIVTAEDFEKNNVFIKEEKSESKKGEEVKLGIGIFADKY